jgi:hypothetical protein
MKIVVPRPGRESGEVFGEDGSVIGSFKYNNKLQAIELHLDNSRVLHLSTVTSCIPFAAKLDCAGEPDAYSMVSPSGRDFIAAFGRRHGYALDYCCEPEPEKPKPAAEEPNPAEEPKQETWRDRSQLFW